MQALAEYKQSDKPVGNCGVSCGFAIIHGIVSVTLNYALWRTLLVYACARTRAGTHRLIVVSLLPTQAQEGTHVFAFHLSEQLSIEGAQAARM